MRSSFKPTMSEQEFLMTLALAQYNKQFNAKLELVDCEIISIRPRLRFRLGYEIRTKATDDYLRFRMYLNLGDEDVVCTYIQHAEQGFTSVENPEDEVPVTFGTVDRWYISEKIYAFRPINDKVIYDEFLELENSTRLVLENGESIELE